MQILVKIKGNVTFLQFMEEKNYRLQIQTKPKADARVHQIGQYLHSI